MRDEPLSPACMKCEQVTGNATCFPGPCVFFHERDKPGTKSNHIAALDRVRRYVTAQAIEARRAATLGAVHESAVATPCAQSTAE